MAVTRRYLPLILVLGVGAALPAASAQGAPPPATGSVTADAVLNQWNVPGGGSTATIGRGGTVAFAYPAGATSHNVVFDDRAPQSCAPPLPGSPTPPGWSSVCAFTELGDYAFHCGLHSTMRGTVRVVTDTVTLGPAAKDLKLNRRQRGRTVKGSIDVARLMSTLDVRAFARRSDLGEGKPGSGQRRIGRYVRFSSVGGGRESFTVKLSKKARRVLSRKGKLRITISVTVTPADGAIYQKFKTIRLRPPK